MENQNSQLPTTQDNSFIQASYGRFKTDEPLSAQEFCELENTTSEILTTKNINSLKEMYQQVNYQIHNLRTNLISIIADQMNQLWQTFVSLVCMNHDDADSKANQISVSKQVFQFLSNKGLKPQTNAFIMEYFLRVCRSLYQAQSVQQIDKGALLNHMLEHIIKSSSMPIQTIDLIGIKTADLDYQVNAALSIFQDLRFLKYPQQEEIEQSVQQVFWIEKNQIDATIFKIQEFIEQELASHEQVIIFACNKIQSEQLKEATQLFENANKKLIKLNEAQLDRNQPSIFMQLQNAVEYKQCLMLLEECTDILEKIPDCVIQPIIDHIYYKAEQLCKEEQIVYQIDQLFAVIMVSSTEALCTNLLKKSLEMLNSTPLLKEYYQNFIRCSSINHNAPQNKDPKLKNYSSNLGLFDVIQKHNLQKYEESINNLKLIIPNWSEFFIEKLNNLQVDAFSQYESAWVLVDLTYFLLGELQLQIKDVEELRINISNDFGEVMNKQQDFPGSFEKLSLPISLFTETSSLQETDQIICGDFLNSNNMIDFKLILFGKSAISQARTEENLIKAIEIIIQSSKISKEMSALATQLFLFFLDYASGGQEITIFSLRQNFKTYVAKVKLEMLILNQIQNGAKKSLIKKLANPKIYYVSFSHDIEKPLKELSIYRNSYEMTQIPIFQHYFDLRGFLVGIFIFNDSGAFFLSIGKQDIFSTNYYGCSFQKKLLEIENIQVHYALTKAYEELFSDRIEFIFKLCLFIKELVYPTSIDNRIKLTDIKLEQLLEIICLENEAQAEYERKEEQKRIEAQRQREEEQKKMEAQRQWEEEQKRILEHQKWEEQRIMEQKRFNEQQLIEQGLKMEEERKIESNFVLNNQNNNQGQYYNQNGMLQQQRLSNNFEGHLPLVSEDYSNENNNQRNPEFNYRNNENMKATSNQGFAQPFVQGNQQNYVGSLGFNNYQELNNIGNNNFVADQNNDQNKEQQLTFNSGQPNTKISNPGYENPKAEQNQNIIPSYNLMNMGSNQNQDDLDSYNIILSKKEEEIQKQQQIYGQHEHPQLNAQLGLQQKQQQFESTPTPNQSWEVVENEQIPFLFSLSDEKTQKLRYKDYPIFFLLETLHKNPDSIKVFLKHLASKNKDISLLLDPCTEYEIYQNINNLIWQQQQRKSLLWISENAFAVVMIQRTSFYPNDLEIISNKGAGDSFWDSEFGKTFLKYTTKQNVSKDIKTYRGLNDDDISFSDDCSNFMWNILFKKHEFNLTEYFLIPNAIKKVQIQPFKIEHYPVKEYAIKDTEKLFKADQDKDLLLQFFQINSCRFYRYLTKKQDQYSQFQIIELLSVNTCLPFFQLTDVNQFLPFQTNQAITFPCSYKNFESIGYYLLASLPHLLLQNPNPSKSYWETIISGQLQQL